MRVAHAFGLAGSCRMLLVVWRRSLGFRMSGIIRARMHNAAQYAVC